MSYLRFAFNVPIKGHKTNVWAVYGGLVQVGVVKWYAQWRRYCFFPNEGTLFEEECLREMATFLEDQTYARRKIQAANRSDKKLLLCLGNL